MSLPSRYEIKHKKHKQHIIICWIVFLLIFLLLILYFFYKMEKTYKSVHTSDINSSKVINQNSLSFLLLGVDTGAHGRIDRGNSDTIIVITINSSNKTINMYSIPRDTMAQIIGTKDVNVQKINAAYNIGKSPMAVSTVSKLLNIPINYYVTVNMGGLEKVIDSVGGVNVISPLTFSYNGYNFYQGELVHLNGKSALAFTRMRHQDPQGDYGRQERQQLVIQALIQKLYSSHDIYHISKFIDSLNGNVKTNLTFKNVADFTKKFHKDKFNIKRYQLIGKTAWINESSYQVIPTSNLQEASNILRKSLGLNYEKLNNMETHLNARNSLFFNGSTQIYNVDGTDNTYYSSNTY